MHEQILQRQPPSCSLYDPLQSLTFIIFVSAHFFRLLR